MTAQHHRDPIQRLGEFFVDAYQRSTGRLTPTLSSYNIPPAPQPYPRDPIQRIDEFFVDSNGQLAPALTGRTMSSV